MELYVAPHSAAMILLCELGHTHGVVGWSLAGNPNGYQVWEESGAKDAVGNDLAVTERRLPRRQACHLTQLGRGLAKSCPVTAGHG